MAEESEAPKYSFDVDAWFEGNRETIKEAFEKAAAGYVADGGEPTDFVNMLVTLSSDYSVGVGRDSFVLTSYYHEAEEPEESDDSTEAAPSGDGVSGE